MMLFVHTIAAHKEFSVFKRVYYIAGDAAIVFRLLNQHFVQVYDILYIVLSFKEACVVVYTV
jgi:hypothetical protein